MNKNSTLVVIQTRVLPDKQELFQQWMHKISAVVQTFPGYQQQDVKPPKPPLQLEWIIIYYFASYADATAWLQSSERMALIQEALPLLLGIDTIYIMDQQQAHPQYVSATITNSVPPKREQQFLAWQMRISAVQSKFPGFIGYTLARPLDAATQPWHTIVTFDSDKHLEQWLTSKERQALVQELTTFSNDLHVEKIYSGFNFWFQDRKNQRSIWKENMLVLLTLYPIVFLLSFIQTPAMRLGVPFWFALFWSNLVSTVALGSLTVPWLMQQFQWWLKPKNSFATIIGAAVVVLLYALSMLLFWFISSKM